MVKLNWNVFQIGDATSKPIVHKHYFTFSSRLMQGDPGLFPALLGKGPWPKVGKNGRLNIKIKDIEQYKGSKL